MLRFITSLVSISIGLLLFDCSGEHTDHSSVEHKIEENHHGYGSNDSAKSEILELPGNLAAVLRLEMVEISNSMGPLLEHLARGNSEEAASIADKIQHSFVLKQKLARGELKQLVRLLPADFVTMDRSFHGNAGKLAKAVRNSNFPLAVELYSEMAQACIACHSQYATSRFPGLSSQ